MNLDLRMDLADCGSPERVLETIFRHYPDLPRQVPIKDIATEVGIVDFKVLEVDGFIGGLTADPEKSQGIILTKEGMNPKRQRYTIGHELGHFLIPTHGYQRQCRKQDLEENSRATSYQRQETEANRFSAGLLMPKKMFMRDVDALGSADVTHVRQLSDQYDVSLEAVTNRYVDLTSDSCAFIFSRNDVIRYARPSKGFPKLNVFKGSALPLGCLTRRTTSVGMPSSWIEQHGGMWLQEEWGSRAPKVLEQAYIQANGFKLTLLFVEKREQDLEEEEVELDSTWHVGFKR